MMDDNKDLQKQGNALTDEELDQVAGGMVNQVGVLENQNKDMLGSAEPVKPTERKSNPFSQNCG